MYKVNAKIINACKSCVHYEETTRICIINNVGIDGSCGDLKLKPIILNRYILREYIEDEHKISSILKKAGNFRITIEKMLPNKLGRLSFTNTFDADVWIKKQTEWIKSVRSDAVDSNTALLEIVKNIVKGLRCS